MSSNVPMSRMCLRCTFVHLYMYVYVLCSTVTRRTRARSRVRLRVRPTSKCEWSAYRFSFNYSLFTLWEWNILRSQFSVGYAKSAKVGTLPISSCLLGCLNAKWQGLGGCIFRAVNGLCTRRIGSTKSHLILDWLRRGSDVKGWEHAWHRDRWKTLYGMRMCALSNMYLYICVWNHEIRSHIESDWAQIPLNRLKETHTHTKHNTITLNARPKPTISHSLSVFRSSGCCFFRLLFIRLRFVVGWWLDRAIYGKPTLKTVTPKHFLVLCSSLIFVPSPIADDNTHGRLIVFFFNANKQKMNALQQSKRTPHSNGEKQAKILKLGCRQ